MKLNSIYTTMQGEVNPFGIGCPVIFLRLQGCHLRCYKRTLGILCDTPEALEKPKDITKINTIFAEVLWLSNKTGIDIITLTGGDPLWNKEEELKELFDKLVDVGLNICVETSGTISWLPYLNDKIHWILDYKLKSAGVKKTQLFKDKKHLESLKKTDYIKFVVYDLEDMKQTLNIIQELKNKTKATLSVGAYWGGKLTTFEIIEHLKNHNELGNITINMQTHKMAIASNFNIKIPTDV